MTQTKILTLKKRNKQIMQLKAQKAPVLCINKTKQMDQLFEPRQKIEKKEKDEFEPRNKQHKPPKSILEIQEHAIPRM